MVQILSSLGLEQNNASPKLEALGYVHTNESSSNKNLFYRYPGRGHRLPDIIAAITASESNSCANFFTNPVTDPNDGTPCMKYR